MMIVGIIKPVVGAACVALASLAWAQPKEITYDTVSCFGGPTQVLVNTPNERYGTFSLSGAVRATAPGGVGDGDTFECAGTFEYRAGVYGSLGYCVMSDKDGDKSYVRDSTGPEGNVLQVVGGTGKFAGASGTGAGERIPGAPPVRAGTMQGCRKNRITVKLQ